MFVDNPFALTAPFKVAEELIKFVALFVDALELMDGIWLSANVKTYEILKEVVAPAVNVGIFNARYIPASAEVDARFPNIAPLDVCASPASQTVLGSVPAAKEEAFLATLALESVDLSPMSEPLLNTAFTKLLLPCPVIVLVEL